MSKSVVINGTTVAAPTGAIAYKYADPTEDARWVYDEKDLQEIASADAGLLVMVEEDSK